MKSFKQLEKDISDIINPQPLDEGRKVVMDKSKYDPNEVNIIKNNIKMKKDFIIDINEMTTLLKKTKKDIPPNSYGFESIIKKIELLLNDARQKANDLPTYILK